MTIDMPKPADIPALRNLWQEAFGDDDTFLDAFFQIGYSPRRCRRILFDGRLAAALYWFDCALEDKKLAYIYAVATDKAFRGRGLCRRLMEDTHLHLGQLGYGGAVLVPGNKKLFSLYEKLGYQSFCPMEAVTVKAAKTASGLTKLTADAFGEKRAQRLRAGSVLQEGQTLSFLSAFASFYESGDNLFCVSEENKKAFFQEYLGQAADLPGILAALGVTEGTVRIAGKEDYAMYHCLDGHTPTPAYFGIPLN